VSAFSDIYLTRIRKADLEDQQWPQLMNAFNDLSDNKCLRIISNPRYKQVEKLCAKIESMALEKRISLVIIDHIQRMNTGVRKNNRHLELSYVSELITSTAQTVKSPMIILSQIRRRPEGEKDRKPELTDLKESGDLEQNADAVVSIYRKDRESEFTEITCLKGRDTGTWSTALRFNRFTQRFYDTDQANPDDVYTPPIVDDWRDR
jgi:replicative DNA helicase